MMEQIKQFFANHKISAHTFAAIWVVADALWYSNKEFHAYISALLMALPAWLHAFIFGIVVPLILYLKTTKPAAPNPTGVKAAALLFATLAVFTLTGCARFERTTFRTLAASQPVIDQAQDDYEARKIPKTQCAQTLINDAKGAQTAAVNGMIVYEKLKATDKDLTAQTAQVASIIAGLPPLITQIKTLYVNPAACGGPQ